MAKRNDEDMPFGEEYKEMLKRSQMMSEIGIDESGERIKRVPKVIPNKSGNAAKKTSTKMRAATSKKRTARQTALKKMRDKKIGLIGGQIPASPTR